MIYKYKICTYISIHTHVRRSTRCRVKSANSPSIPSSVISTTLPFSFWMFQGAGSSVASSTGFVAFTSAATKLAASSLSLSGKLHEMVGLEWLPSLHAINTRILYSTLLYTIFYSTVIYCNVKWFAVIHYTNVAPCGSWQELWQGKASAEERLNWLKRS